MAADSPLFVAIDVGTTGARACAVDLQGRLIHQARRPYSTTTPHPGWAEQDPRDWREASLDALGELIAALGGGDAIHGIGLTGQCPTIAPISSDHEPVGPGLLYRDNRATAQAKRMRERIGVKEMHRRTGHVADAFHVGPKVLWMREHEPSRFAATDRFMQPRDVVLQALTGITATDETHANATVFFDLASRAWADDLLDQFSLDRSVFPDVAPPWTHIGALDASTCARTGAPVACPVVLGAADSQCAAYGSAVRAPGTISEMAGASSCLNSVVDSPLRDPRITHYSYLLPDVYCTELGLNTTGAAAQWAVRQLGVDGYRELDAGANELLLRIREGLEADARMVAPLFLPYLGDGERDDVALRGAFIGLSDRHGSRELSYSVLEGLAFGVAETLTILTAAGSPLEELRVAGGAARLSSLGAIKADVLGVPVVHMREDSAPVGVALLAADRFGYAAAAAAGLEQNLARATRFEPDARSEEAIRERYEWFVRVRGSDAVRIQS